MLYAYDKKTNQTYFLFSHESHGADKGKWSDFGGKADKKDHNNALKIAARECAEESNVLFGSYRHLLSHLSQMSSSVLKIDKPYALFLVQVAYDKNINRIFQRKLARAKSPHKHEKNKLAWVSAKNLEKALIGGAQQIYVRNREKITLRSSVFNFLRAHALPLIQKLAKRVGGKARMLTIKP